MYAGPQRSFTERMIGAAMLNVDVYEEVEADTTATQSAALVVVIVAIASATGQAVLTAVLGFVAWVILGGLLTIAAGGPAVLMP
jgi:hypothetical protein